MKNENGLRYSLLIRTVIPSDAKESTTQLRVKSEQLYNDSYHRLLTFNSQLSTFYGVFKFNFVSTT